MQNLKQLKKKKFRSSTKRKILLLLQTGLALSLTPSLKMHGYILQELSKDWKNINRDYLKRVIQEFRYERLIDWQESNNGTIRITLTKLGKEYALEFNIDEIKIKEPAFWDEKWRLVFFDIPETKRGARNALRDKLKELGFFELQKSVFINPYPCQNEIDFIVEFFQLRPFVRYAEATNLTNEEELKLHFNLS